MALSKKRISIWRTSEFIRRQVRRLYPNTITEHTLEMEGYYMESPKNDINALIEVCNQNDRFNLLDDDVPPADLDNSIHPIFAQLSDLEGTPQQALRLASLFLTCDSVVVFFVRLLYGQLRKTSDQRFYLSDLLADATDGVRDAAISGVRDALHCLSHSLTFYFVPLEELVYARTILDTKVRTCISKCTPLFRSKHAVKIGISNRTLDYYKNPKGYANATRCAQFRHDLLFATTLVHEVSHAVGVLRRGHLKETYISAEYPDTEWGFAWEHFMFGCIMNPHDRSREGTYILVRKVWADSEEMKEAGGKEYCPVSMSYIAQWFRKDTWDIIARKGPVGIPPPVTHFKVHASTTRSVWIVSHNSRALKNHLYALYLSWKIRAKAYDAEAFRIYLRIQTHKRLQAFHVAPPERMEWTQSCPPLSSPGTCSLKLKSPRVLNGHQAVAVCRAISPDPTCSRKRKADGEIDSNRSQIIKR